MKEGEITPGITAEEYITRRKRLLELLPEKSVAIIAAAPVKMMTDVVPYTFRQDADYLYVTGCLQQGGLAVLSREFGFCMFMPEAKPHVWPILFILPNFTLCPGNLGPLTAITFQVVEYKS